jgi:hypothetical protein
MLSQSYSPEGPDLVELEKSGQGVRGEPEQEGWITMDSEDGFTFESMIDLDKCDQSSPLQQAEVLMDSGDSQDQSLASINNSSTSDSCHGTAASKKHKTPSPPLAPPAYLPSPLLCLRRTFLASLILASKFTQDRCYSNRAWAKLSSMLSQARWSLTRPNVHRQWCQTGPRCVRAGEREDSCHHLHQRAGCHRYEAV